MTAMARPHTIATLRTPEIVDDVIARISKGETLAAICRTPGYPATRTFYDWVEVDEELSARFARARKVGFDAIADETIAIADTPPAYTQTEGGMRIDAADIQHRKLQIETRLKLLAKWDPKRYGDKVQVDGPGAGGSHIVRVVTGVPDGDD